MRNKIISLTLTVIFVLLSCSCNDITVPAQQSGYKVICVVDGDTIIVDADGEKTKVRMIGIDTPESVHNDENRNCEFGKSASEYTKSLLIGQYVELEYDEQRTDIYDRILAYVYLDGEMVNQILVLNGYAVAKNYPPNVKYSELLRSAQVLAEEQKVGMWSNSVSDEDTGGLKEKYNMALAT